MKYFAARIRLLYNLRISMTPSAALLFLLMLVPAQNKDAQSNSAHKPAAPPEVPGVEVSAQFLTPTKFCEYGPKAYLVYFPVEITVTNGRRTPIILTRQLSISRVLLGANISEVWAHKYEMGNHTAARLSGHSSDFDGSPSSSPAFVVLKHNQSYSFIAVQGIGVSNDAASAVANTVPAGDLNISLELQTWPYQRDPAALSNQWSRYGDVISGPAFSFPVEIKLPANPVVQKCALIAPPG
jgi:hypothetical protein